jgi:hypothetical protein
MTNLYRFLLIFAAVVAGTLNGSLLAAPVLILATYFLCLAVRYAQEAQDKYTRQRIREIRYAATLAR